MKVRPLICFFLLLALGLGAGTAWAQPTCALPNPPGGCTFVAIDVATGLTVEAFCVGRGVRFEPCPSRTIDLSTGVYYGVLPGVGSTYLNAVPACRPPNQSPYTFVPQPANVGMVTVSELANENGVPKYYIRTYQVYASPPPAFTVAPCPGGSALVTVTDAVYDSYSVQAGAGPPQAILPNRATVVPLPAGATALTVTGRYAAQGLCEGAATQAIAPLSPAQVPALTRLTLDAAPPGGTAIFEVDRLPGGYRYTLQRADAGLPGGYRAVAEVPPMSSTVALAGAPAGCYRLRRTDPCHLDSAFSPLVCTLGLTGRSVAGRNQLLLADAGAGNGYTVTRDGQPLPAISVIAGGLEDPNVACGTTYTYRVTAQPPGGGQAVSNPVVILTQSAVAPAPPRLVASVNARNVVVLTPLPASGPLPTGSILRYRRTAGPGLPVDFGTATGLQPQRDSTALSELLARPPCYSVRVTDVCGNTSADGPVACPSLLTAAAADPEGSTAALRWTAFAGPDPAQPTVYVLQRLAPDGAVLSTLPVSGTSYTDLTPPTDVQVLRYRLQISGAGLPAGTFSLSNVATVARRVLLTIPTAFTPNGDGLNDVLEVKGRYLTNYTFVVVDRNGQEVFRGTQRADAWDGTVRGHAPVLGAYVWRFMQTSDDGTPFVATGAVTILK